MLKNITFRAEEHLIKRARDRAASEKTTRNNEFRRWLEKYARQAFRSEDFNNLMQELTYVQVGGKFTRDEMNER